MTWYICECKYMDMKYLHAIPNFEELLSKYPGQILKLSQLARMETNRTDAYRSWEEIRYRSGPDGISSEEWWLGIKFNRLQARQLIPLKNNKGKPFNYAINNLIIKQLHFIDCMSGGVLSSDASTALPKKDKTNYLVSSLIEESIMSSILEGASVTRSDAKAMLRENRAPKDIGEQMIVNNYRTMRQIINWKDEPLSPELLLSLHKLMTEGTLSNREREGKWRQTSDNVRVEEEFSGEIIHLPPPAEKVPELIKDLCNFANNEDENYYLHPVLKAVILHFWLAYVHPFTDGNGRTARALFYWIMLKNNFWLFEYITISNEIRKKKNGKSYYYSFLYTERDDEDLNYFICDQLLTIAGAITSFHNYIRDKKKEQEALLTNLNSHLNLNSRQKQLLSSMLKDADMLVTFESHANYFRVARQTARTDLLSLVNLKYLIHDKQGKTNIFKPAPDLENRLSL